MQWVQVFVIFLGVGLGIAERGLGEEPRQAFQAAEELERDGKLQEAFGAYLAIPGAQHAAVQLGRRKPDEYLAVLRREGGGIAVPLAKVVEGDLLLVQGKRDEALASYRLAAGCVATTAQEGWREGCIPADGYLVEPSRQPSEMPCSPGLLIPFSLGPGSHRDNWLLRRFIALDAWDDAAREFARIWAVHRQNTQPYVVEQEAHRTDGQPPQRVRFVVRPAGFNGRGLQFALDYAFFLKRRQQEPQALAVLEEALLAIDMDRNPNMVDRRPLAPGEDVSRYPVHSAGGSLWGWAHQDGISRQDFIRVAYGAFKEAAQEETLTATLQKRIDGGEIRLLRVLARIRIHQGRPVEASALELAYIHQAGFDPFSATWRRGLVLEEVRRLEDAVAAYEALLKLPYIPNPRMPEADEETLQQRRMRQWILYHPDPAIPAGRAVFQTEILDCLNRLYGALGKTDRSFEITLEQFEANPALLEHLDLLEQTGRQATALKREDRFRQWLRVQVAAGASSEARANAFWVLQDYPACAKAVAEACKTTKRQHVWWRDRFRRAVPQHLPTLLDELIRVDPENAEVRLELLDVKGRYEDAELVHMLELLLKTDASFAFQQGKGAHNPTRFRNYFDLAYRLMRLYEKRGQRVELMALGLRIAAGEEPFGLWWKPESSYRFSMQNGWAEDLNACLSVMLQNADGKTIATLAELWKTLPDFPAKRQLARRQAGGLAKMIDANDIGWQHLPEGVRLIASSANVLSLARDDRYVYAGYPWGIEVYDLQGEPVTRLALGQAVNALAAGREILWAGTPRGLFRIDRDGWSVSQFWTREKLAAQNVRPHPLAGPGSHLFEDNVHTLVLDGDDLWVGLNRGLRRLDVQTMTLREFSLRELQAEEGFGVDYIVPDRKYIWVANQGTILRYDRTTDTWDRVEANQHGISLIGVVDGNVFASIWVDDVLRYRPALIDRDTLKVTPLTIDADSAGAEQLVNERFSFFGKYRGQIVVGPGAPAYVVDVDARRIRPLPANWNRQADALVSVLPEGFRRGQLCWNESKPSKPNAGSPEAKDVVVRGGADGMTVLASADGLVVAGRRYRPNVSDADNENGGQAGLWFFAGDGSAARVSQSPRTDRLAGDVVFSMVDDGANGRTWLCTDCGLAVLDAENRVAACLTRDDGLVANRVTSGVVFGDRLYFSTGWGDHGGGLAVFDPATSVLSAWFAADGLATDKLDSVEVVAEGVKLTYGVEYGRYARDYRYRQFPPGVFDPRSRQIRSGGAPRTFSDENRPPLAGGRFATADPQAPRLPYLGGRLLGKQTIGKKTYLYGECGLAILDDETKPASEPAELRLNLVVDPEIGWLKEAQSTPITINSPDDLEKALKASNPLLRAEALAKLLGRVDGGLEHHVTGILCLFPLVRWL